MTAETISCFVMSGGVGSRLWPLSREQFPKQFLSLTENSSLLQVTARRAAALDPAQAIRL